MHGWLNWVLIVVALATTLLGVAKDILPNVPKVLMLITAVVTVAGAVLKFYQDARGQSLSNQTTMLAENVPASPDAPSKVLSNDHQRLYANIKEEAKRFRRSKIKLFFSPSIDAGTLYRLGLLAFNQRDPTEAEINLKYALELDPDHTDAFNLLLQLYQSEAMKRLQRGEYDQVEEYMQEAQRLVADSAIEGDLRTMTLLGAVYKTLGQVYERRGKQAVAEQYWKQAGEIFTQLHARAPEDPSILVGLGNFLDHQREFHAALGRYEAALDAAPKYTAAANDAAIACMKLMQQDSEQMAQWQEKACAYWQKAISLSKHDPQFDDNYRAVARRQMAKVCQ